MDVLWPELDASAAARNLRKVVHFARRTLAPEGGGDSLIVSAGDALALPLDVWIDVHAFQAAAEAARRARDPRAYRDAIALHAGDLLPEDRYEPWVMERQEELRAEYLALLAEMADLLESRGDLDEAAAAMRRVVESEPLDEDASVRLMRISALAGRRAEALDEYERLRGTLQRELGVDPEPSTQRLREEIAARQGLAPELTAELWERVGDLRLLSGDDGGAAAAFESAIEAMRDAVSEQIVRLHRKAAQALLVAHDPDRAEPHLADAESRSPDDPAERGRSLVLRANASWERGNLERSARAAEEGLRLSEAHGTPDDVAAAHEAVAIACHVRGAWREGLRPEIERLEALPEPSLARVFDIHHCIGQYHLYGDGLWESVEGFARGTLERAERAGAVRAQAFAWCLLGESLLLQGRFDEAAGCLQRSGELHSSLGTRSGALPWQRLAELLACRGEANDAGVYIRRASAIATVSPMARHVWGRIHATAALACLQRGDPGGAVRHVRAAAASAARYSDCTTCSALLHPVAAEAYAAFGDAESARPHVAAAGRVADSFASTAWRAMAESSRGSLASAEGNRSRARGRFLRAAELYEMAGQPFWADRARSMAGG